MNYMGRRLTALVLDYVVILAWMGTLAAASALVYLALGYYPDILGILGPVGNQIFFFFLLTFVVGVYLYRCESGPHQSTWGKRRMGLKVESARGPELSRHQVLIRTVVKLLPWEFAHVFIWQMMWTFHQEGYDAVPPIWVFIGLNTATAAAILYVIMVIATRRGPHDRIARTIITDVESWGKASPGFRPL